MNPLWATLALLTGIIALTAGITAAIALTDISYAGLGGGWFGIAVLASAMLSRDTKRPGP